MRVNIVSNLDNGKGLEKDFRILEGLLSGWGHEVRGVHFASTAPAEPADLAIFLEVCEPRFFDAAPRRWLVPNPEWWTTEKNVHLDDFEAVLCKTRDALRIFAPLTPRAVLTGFCSVDRGDPSVRRQRRFLHLAGDSTIKGTEAVLLAWERYAIRHSLTVVSSRAWRRRPARVTFLPHVPDAELRRLQNAHLHHLYPSRYEGWGHTIHEALSASGVVVTTDTPPMSEIEGCARLVPPVSFTEQGLAAIADVSPRGIRDAVAWCASLREVEATRIGARAREAFSRGRAEFIRRLSEMLDAPRGGAYSPSVEVVSSSPVEGARLSPSPSAPPSPRIAMVFPCPASRAALVRRTVFALRTQTVDPGTFEVVVACDGGDGQGILRDAVEPERHPFRVTMVDSPRPRGDIPHRNHARNAGWRAATAPLCCMLDADFLLPPHAIEHILAEHDAAVARGRPAVLTPVLARIAMGVTAWEDYSGACAERGDAASYANLLAEVPVEGGVYSGYGDRHRPGLPSSESLSDLLEVMPILWRGLLEALGGFDEWFVGWGAEKEAFVDLLKGLNRAGLVDIRLLTSVRAIHQPHEFDPEGLKPGVARCQRERARRLDEIHQGAPWWRAQLEKARRALGAAVAAAAPRSS